MSIYQFTNNLTSRAITLLSMDADNDSDLAPLDPSEITTYSDNDETTKIDSIASGESGYASLDAYSFAIATNSGYYTLNGDITYLNGFPVADVVTDFETTDIEIGSTNIASYLEAFNFVRYISANPTSTVAKNFNDVVANSDATDLVSNVTAFCQEIDVFANVTGTSWRQMTLWQTRDFSPWVGTYYVYPTGVSDEDALSQLAQIDIVFDSTTNESTATLTMTDSGESVGLKFAWETSSDDSEDEYVYIVNTNFGEGTDPVEVKLQPSWVTLTVDSVYQTVGAFSGTVGDQDVCASPNQYDSDDDSSDSSSSSGLTSYQEYSLVSSITSQGIGLAMLIVMVIDSIKASRKSGSAGKEIMKELSTKLDEYNDRLENFEESQKTYLNDIAEAQSEQFQDSIDKAEDRLKNVIEAQGYTDDNTKAAASSIETAKDGLKNGKTPETMLGYVQDMDEKVAFSEDAAFGDSKPSAQVELAKQTAEKINNAEEIQKEIDARNEQQENNEKESPELDEDSLLEEEVDVDPIGK
ncbi:MAG: hypothetical protein F6J90_28195 [Moorea sp. SIOASIH]|uniref:hypothetical protein n=1 Tax=Moorena sp. SIOASIH TaxID=2607817 RepID=UPI0013BB53A1|nr:hypothetical protein [Moorena sp. SIOASIH]NEO40006.1 hypothetical protein [Moorena sp. SIOASIH]